MDQKLNNKNDFWYRDVSFNGVNVNDYRQFVYKLATGLDSFLIDTEQFSFSNLSPTHGLNYWDRYNIFEYQNEMMYDLLQHIKSLMSKACNELGIDYDQQKYHIHGWVDVYNGDFNNTDVSNLSWYDEAIKENVFAGMFLLHAEDSFNYYVKNGDVEEIENTPGRLQIFTNHKWFHGKWTESGPKIILSFNIYPLSSLPELEDYVARYIPL
jgi:hypothetical protein